jgi:ankyrin repeat protein
MERARALPVRGQGLSHLEQQRHLDLPLTQAVTFNRAEYVRLLLGAGADPGTRTRGITPLENAIYSDATQVVDLFGGHGIVP